MASLHPLSEPLNVDRAVSRLARIQSSLHHTPPPRRHSVALELATPCADNHGNISISMRPLATSSSAELSGSVTLLLLSAGKGHVRQSSTAEKLGQSVKSKQHCGNKENVGRKKKRRKRRPSVAVQNDALARSPSEEAMAKSRPALKNKPINVVGAVTTDSFCSSGRHLFKSAVAKPEYLRPDSAINADAKQASSDMNGDADSLELKLEPPYPSHDLNDAESRFSVVESKRQRRKSRSEPSSNVEGRPPWRNFTTIPNNPLPTTIAERVKATDGSLTFSAMLKKKKKKKRAKKKNVNEGEAEMAMADYSMHPSSGIGEKTFCVDVRPNPNRPWRLSTKSTISAAKPLVMFPNPAFKSLSTSGRGYGGSDVGCRNSIPSRGPKQPGASLKSFQLRPYTHDEQIPPATIRPYMSPSKTSPRHSIQAEYTGNSLSFTLDSNSSRSSSSSSTAAAPASAVAKKNSLEKKGSCWLRKRLSLPCASISSSSTTAATTTTTSPSSFMKRFSLLNSPHKSEEFPWRKPSAWMIPSLPSRKNKRTSIASLLGYTNPTTVPPPRAADATSFDAQIDRIDVAVLSPAQIQARRTSARRGDYGAEEASVVHQSVRMQRAMEELMIDRRFLRNLKVEGKAKEKQGEESGAEEASPSMIKRSFSCCGRCHGGGGGGGNDRER